MNKIRQDWQRADWKERTVMVMVFIVLACIAAPLFLTPFLMMK